MCGADAYSDSIPVFTYDEFCKARSIAFCQGILAALKEIEDVAYDVAEGRKKPDATLKSIETLRLQTLERLTTLATHELRIELYRETDCLIEDV